jgi:hypothetical protein
MCLQEAQTVEWNAVARELWGVPASVGKGAGWTVSGDPDGLSRYDKVCFTTAGS